MIHDVVPGVPVDGVVLALDGGLEVSWGAPEDDGGAPVVSYRVEYRLASGDEWELHAEGAQSPAVIVDLENGESYEVRVAAVNEVGRGDWVSAGSGVPAEAPLPPAGIWAHAYGEGTVRVVWEWTRGGVYVDDFRVEYRSAGEEAWTLHGLVRPREEIRGRSAVVSDLAVGVVHEFRVRSVGRGASSTWVTLEFTPRGIPSVPLDVQVMAFGDDRVGVSWLVPEYLGSVEASEMEYPVEYRRVGADGWEQGPSQYLRDGRLTVVLEGLASRSAYEVRVRSKVVNTGSSEWVEGSVDLSGVPWTPSDVVLFEGNGQVVVSWGPPVSGGPDLTGYWVEYRLGDSSEWVLHGDSAQSPTTVGGLENQRYYRVRVASANSLGAGEYVVLPATPADVGAGAPGAPTSLVVTPQDERLSLSWDAPSSGADRVHHYEVAYRRSGSDTWQYTLSSGTSAFVPGLTNNRLYEIAVKAVSQQDEKSGALVFSATPMDLSLEPKSLRATGAHHRVDLRWTAPQVLRGQSIAGYRIEYRESSAAPGVDWTVAAESHRATRFTIAELAPDTPYEVRVQTLGPQDTSEFVTATVRVPNTPGPPLNLEVRPGDQQNGLAASWDPPAQGVGSPATSYQIHLRAKDSNSGWVLSRTVTGTSWSLAHFTLYTSTVYEVRVTSRNENGDGGHAIGSASPSRGPGGFSTGRFTPARNSINVVWTSAAAKVRLEYRKHSSGEWQALEFEGGSGEHAITGLTAGTPYQVNLTPFAVGGAAGQSFEGTITPFGTPDPPQNMRYVLHGDTLLHYQWDPPTGTSADLVWGYEVAYAPTGTPIDEHTTLLVRGAHVGLTGLTAGTDYSVKVRTVSTQQDAEGVGYRSSWGSIGAPWPEGDNIATPGLPHNPVTTITWDIPNKSSFTRSTSGMLYIAWDAPQETISVYPTTHYTIGWKKEAGAALQTATTTSTNYTISGLEDDVDYTIQIWAYNEHGRTPPSPPITATPTNLTRGERTSHWAYNNIIRGKVAEGYEWLEEVYFNRGLDWIARDVVGADGVAGIATIGTTTHSYALSIDGVGNFSAPLDLADNVSLDYDHLSNKWTIVHELAHIYTLAPTEASDTSNPPTRDSYVVFGYMHLKKYMDDRRVKSKGDCKITELAADALATATGYNHVDGFLDSASTNDRNLYHAGLLRISNYWQKCSKHHANKTCQILNTLLDIKCSWGSRIPDTVAGEIWSTFNSVGWRVMPPWAYRTYSTGWSDSANDYLWTYWNHEAIWTDAKAVASMQYHLSSMALWNLRTHFGGYCNLALAALSLNDAAYGWPVSYDASDITNPWNHNGLNCRSSQPSGGAAEALVRQVDGASTLAVDVSWEAPSVSGGAPIEGYRVRWKTPHVSLNQDYSDSTTTEVDADVNEYTITGLDPNTDYTVSVEAKTNHYGYSAAWETTVTTQTISGSPSAVQDLAASPNSAALGDGIELVVSWSPPESDTCAGGASTPCDSEVTHYLVRRRHQDGSYHSTERQATVQAEDQQSFAFTIDSGLEHGERYEIAVGAVNAAGTGQEAVVTAQAQQAKKLLHRFIEDDVVEVYEDDWPWVESIWAKMPKASVSFSEESGRLRRCDEARFQSNPQVPTCWYESMSVDDDKARDSAEIVRLLAGAFLHYTRDGTTMPEAMGAAYLYFSSRDTSRCSLESYMAQTLAVVTMGADDYSVSQGCAVLVDDAAQTVMRDGLSAQLPAWYLTTYQREELNDGKWAYADLERLWREFRTIPQVQRKVAYYFMRGMHGGFCLNNGTERRHAFANYGSVKVPWKDGGCSAGLVRNLIGEIAPGQITVSWDLPDPLGMSPIYRYFVTWEPDSGSGATGGNATITDTSTMSYTITGLQPETTYTIEVAGNNTYYRNTRRWTTWIGRVTEGAPETETTTRIGGL